VPPPVRAIFRGAVPPGKRIGDLGRPRGGTITETAPCRRPPSRQQSGHTTSFGYFAMDVEISRGSGHQGQKIIDSITHAHACPGGQPSMLYNNCWMLFLSVAASCRVNTDQPPEEFVLNRGQTGSRVIFGKIRTSSVYVSSGAVSVLFHEHRVRRRRAGVKPKDRVGDIQMVSNPGRFHVLQGGARAVL